MPPFRYKKPRDFIKNNNDGFYLRSFSNCIIWANLLRKKILNTEEPDHFIVNHITRSYWPVFHQNSHCLSKDGTCFSRPSIQAISAHCKRPNSSDCDRRNSQNSLDGPIIQEKRPSQKHSDSILSLWTKQIFGKFHGLGGLNCALQTERGLNEHTSHVATAVFAVDIPHSSVG